MNPPEALEAIRRGDHQSLARLITSLERGDPETADLVESLEATATTPQIGVTGPPGAGKSTLVNEMIKKWRTRGETVAVLAVDPSSPITGGALLGDRIRMQEHASDEGVFIRSMATRGHLGGLAEAAHVTIRLLSHAGFDHVIVETVGVGQSEVEVMHLVDVVILVLAPGWGDQIQADKAGIVEIADVYVVNKGDLPGAEDVKHSLGQAVGSQAPILVTAAITGEGIDSLMEAIASLG